jgi:Ca-activated chloride channel family protein
MSFIWPQLLYMLMCVPLLVIIYARMQRRRREYAMQYGSLGSVQSGAAKNPRKRRHIPAIAFLMGITFLITSAARPQAPVSLPKLEGTVILTFDVSGSMSADDLQPSRMEAAKAAAGEFVKKQPPSVLIGVVAFSDGGLSVQTPTSNKDEILATIDRLEPKRGTSLGNGILVSLNTIAINEGDPPILQTSNPADSPTPIPEPQGWYTSSMIVLLSDGENNENPDPVVAADLAADLGVRIYTIGIGSTSGALINVDGFTIQSQLDESLLQSIADTTGGKYYFGGNEEDLGRIYSDLKPKLSIKSEEMEITAILAGFGFLILLIGGILSFLWFGHVP